MTLVKSHLDVRDPLDTESPFYVLIETAGSNKDHDEEKVATLLESLLENQTIADGALAQDSSQFHAMWRIREGIPEACSKSGSVLKVPASTL
jgi:D-lactate dehydrogenase (cytochrome)